MKTYIVLRKDSNMTSTLIGMYLVMACGNFPMTPKNMACFEYWDACTDIYIHKLQDRAFSYCTTETRLRFPGMGK